MRRAALALVVLVAVPALACAQQPLPMAAEPLVYERDGSVIGCGIRVTGGKPEPREPSSWFDISVSVFRRGIALAQAFAYDMPRSGNGESRPARVPVQSAWINAGTGTAKLGENTERQDALVYNLALDDALTLFDAASRGFPVTLGIKRWGQRAASVQEGTATLSDESRERIAACVTRLAQ